MGEMADYDMYENINNVGRVEQVNYKCGHCHKRFFTNKKACELHVKLCEGTKK